MRLLVLGRGAVRSGSGIGAAVEPRPIPRVRAAVLEARLSGGRRASGRVRPGLCSRGSRVGRCRRRSCGGAATSESSAMATRGFYGISMAAHGGTQAGRRRHRRFWWWRRKRVEEGSGSPIREARYWRNARASSGRRRPGARTPAAARAFGPAIAASAVLDEAVEHCASVTRRLLVQVFERQPASIRLDTMAPSGMDPDVFRAFRSVASGLA